MRAHQLLDSFFFQQDSSGFLPPYILESLHPISISDTEAVSET